MSNVLTPKEWKDDNYPNIDWNDKRVSEYAVYYHSKMQEQGIKKDIILPEYKSTDPTGNIISHYFARENEGFNKAIDEVKLLNGKQ